MSFCLLCYKISASVVLHEHWWRASAQLPAQWAYEHSPRQILSPACMELSSWVSPDCANQFQGREQPWASLICKKTYSPQVFIGLSAISEIFHRLSRTGFHPGDIPQLCQRLSHSAHLGWICFPLAGYQCQECCSRPHTALTSPNRYLGCEQQETCTGGFCLGLWRINKRRRTENHKTSSLNKIHSLRLTFCCEARRGSVLNAEGLGQECCWQVFAMFPVVKPQVFL